VLARPRYDGNEDPDVDPDISMIYTVSVLDVNDRPVLPPDVFSVQENAVNGLQIGVLMATDQDALTINGVVRTDPLTYARTSINADFPFVVLANGSLIVNGSVDFERMRRYTFNVTVTDSGGVARNAANRLNRTTEFVIIVQDVNEPPTVRPSYNFTVPENLPPMYVCSWCGRGMGRIRAVRRVFLCGHSPELELELSPRR
jgi:hypothetical protein